MPAPSMAKGGGWLLWSWLPHNVVRPKRQIHVLLLLHAKKGLEIRLDV